MVIGCGDGRGFGFIISWATLGPTIDAATRRPSPSPPPPLPPPPSLPRRASLLGTSPLHGQATQELQWAQHQLPRPQPPPLSHPLQCPPASILLPFPFPLPRRPQPLRLPRVGHHRRRRLSCVDPSPRFPLPSASNTCHSHPGAHHRAQRLRPSPSCHLLNIQHSVI